MSINRRQFLGGSLALGAVTAIGAPVAAPAAPVAACAPPIGGGPAPLDTLVLNRLGFGPRPGDRAAFRALGATDDARIAAYLEQQLNPNFADDPECNPRIAGARIKIRYGTQGQAGYVNEARPFVNLAKSTPELWPLTDFGSSIDYQERIRPSNEVRVYTWLRAVYSRWQLYEVMVDFWHNHFNVNINSEVQIAATFPEYDRVIRTHALGNFRVFTEEIGKTTAMMYYLDNKSNRATGGEGGNENYARELFELQTLGSENYLKFYDRRSSVGTITWGEETFAEGYLDADVYEAADCLTGWTVANGDYRLPDGPEYDNGTFLFHLPWHTSGPKLVLIRNASVDDAIENKANPIAEGQEVFNRVCYHPGTARYLCTKLCRRLIADDPPQRVIDAAVETWMIHRASPDQIKHVLRTIILSPEFKNTFGLKIKRPLEALWGFLRATNASLPVDVVGELRENGTLDESRGGYWGSLFFRVDASGHRLFGWPTPTGHPDIAEYWANTNSTLNLWNNFYQMTQWWGGNVQIDAPGQTDLNQSCAAIVDFWVDRIVGRPIAPTSREALIAFFAQGGDPQQAPRPREGAPDWNSQDGVLERVTTLVQLIGSLPEYLAR